jgi:hypothetical protein
VAELDEFDFRSRTDAAGARDQGGPAREEKN